MLNVFLACDMLCIQYIYYIILITFYNLSRADPGKIQTIRMFNAHFRIIAKFLFWENFQSSEKKENSKKSDTGAWLISWPFIPPKPCSLQILSIYSMTEVPT